MSNDIFENPSIQFNDEEMKFRVDFEGSQEVQEELVKLYLSMRFAIDRNK